MPAPPSMRIELRPSLCLRAVRQLPRSHCPPCRLQATRWPPKASRRILACTQRVSTSMLLCPSSRQLHTMGRSSRNFSTSRIRSSLSMTMGLGCFSGSGMSTPGRGSRTLSRGWSAKTVLMPTSTPSCRALRECSSLNEVGDEMSSRVRFRGAIDPSSVCAYEIVTNGRVLSTTASPPRHSCCCASERARSRAALSIPTPPEAPQIASVPTTRARSH